jgi:hypothetical protein
MDDLAIQAMTAQLVAQRGELAAQRAAVTSLQAEVSRLRRRRRHARLLPAIIAVLLLALAPAALLAAGFTDLNAGSPHNDNINAIADAGITKGCNPPANDQYCPNDLVTREQMASFLARTAGLGGNPPVANAKTALTAGSATSAGNANTVGGFAPSGLLRVARSQKTSGYPALNRNGVPVNSVTLSPPGPGFVLVTATVGVYIDPSGGRVNYVEAWIQDTGATGAAAQSPRLYISLANRTGYAYTDNGTITWAFPVAGTTPRTFQVIASQDFDPDGVYYNQTYLSGEYGYGGAMTALFVPFGPDGGTTLAP